MKKSLSTILLSFLISVPFITSAQEFRLTPYYGYTFQDKIPTYQGDGYIRDASNFGGLLQFMPNEGLGLTFLFKYSKPDFDFRSYSYFYDDIKNLPTTTNYFMFGITRFFQGTDEVVSPFGTFYIGWSSWKPEKNYSSFSRFSMGLDLGVSVRATDLIGFNLRSELMLPIQGFGSGIYCGTGGGCGVSFETVTSITQFGFTGGVEIRLAPKAKSNEFYTY